MNINNKKILLISPHPDDEVIACGGFIAKYHDQIDILCVNSSGVKYKHDKLSAEEIAEIRCNEFKTIMQIAKVNDYDITKIFGNPPMINSIKEHFNHYINRFDYSIYDIILVPHAEDNHIEHRYVGNILLKQILKKVRYKKDLIIMRYELWSPMKAPNYYEDITDFVDLKIQYIKSYKSRINSHYAERILGLNKYRTLSSYFWNPEKYVEAFYIESVDEYLNTNNFKYILQKLFSIKNEYHDNIKHKCITIFGIIIKFQILEKQMAAERGISK